MEAAQIASSSLIIMGRNEASKAALADDDEDGRVNTTGSVKIIVAAVAGSIIRKRPRACITRIALNDEALGGAPVAQRRAAGKPPHVDEGTLRRGSCVAAGF